MFVGLIFPLAQYSQDFMLFDGRQGELVEVRILIISVEDQQRDFRNIIPTKKIRRCNPETEIHSYRLYPAFHLLILESVFLVILFKNQDDIAGTAAPCHGLKTVAKIQKFIKAGEAAEFQELNKNGYRIFRSDRIPRFRRYVFHIFRQGHACPVWCRKSGLTPHGFSGEEAEQEQKTEEFTMRHIVLPAIMDNTSEIYIDHFILLYDTSLLLPRKDMSPVVEIDNAALIREEESCLKVAMIICHKNIPIGVW